jgi:putative transposase
MKYNPQIHHRQSMRLKGYDYSKAGLYFITICTHNGINLYGNIENEKMILNNAGNIANDCWIEIPKHFPNAVLHNYVIMPNHVHGIIELIDKNGCGNIDNAGIQNFETLQNPQPQQNQFQKIIPRSVGSIIRGFKIGVTKWFRNNTDIHTVWQHNFHERIIRSHDDYKRIKQYIIDNPKNLLKDKLK